MRTTIDIPDEQRAELLRMAGERGETDISRIIQQAIDEYLGRHKAALAVLGTLSEASAVRLEETVHALRSNWR